MDARRVAGAYLIFQETLFGAGSYLSSNAGTSPAQEASDHD